LPEILTDAVHRVHDVVADLEVGQRDRDALLHRAQLHALGGRAEDLTVAQHAQPQPGDREARFQRTGVDVDRTAPRADRHAVGAGRAQVNQARAALDAQVRPAQDFGQSRGTVHHEPHRLAGLRPAAHGLDEALHLAAEVFARLGLEPEALDLRRKPAEVAGLDAAGHDQHAARGERVAIVGQPRCGCFEVGQQRFPDLVGAHVEFARIDAGQERVAAGSPLGLEALVDGCQHPGLFEHDDVVRVEVVEERRAFVVGVSDPRLGYVVPGGEVGAHRRDDVGRPDRAVDDPRAHGLVAHDLAPRHDRHRVELVGRALRLDLEGPDRLELVAEEFEPHRAVGRGREQVEDAAAHREVAGRADHVDPLVAEPGEPGLQRLPARLVAGAHGEAFGVEAFARDDVLAQRRERRDDDLRLARAEIGQQRHAGAAVGGRFQRPDRLVARPHQGRGARLVLAQVVGEVGVGALGHVGRGDDDQQRAAQRPVDAGQQVRSRCGGGLVESEREPPAGGRAQALDQLREGSAARGKGSDEGRGEDRGVGHSPVSYHD
jgi:hypothetical protein